MRPIHANPSIRSYENRLHTLMAQQQQPTNGFFGPDSASWAIYRDPVMGLGGMRALLLQIAHPAVAQGVARYSNFRTDTFGRAQRTFQAMAGLVFGDCQQALQIARMLYRIHSSIKGQIGERSFQATDPDLLLWIQATLIDMAFTIFEASGQPLPASVKEQFYKESHTMALLMGIPPELYPKDLRAFDDYFQSMIQGDILQVDELTLELTEALLHPPFVPSAIPRLLATALLPDHLQRAFGFSYTRTQQSYFQSLCWLSRTATNWLPGLSAAPPYHLARYRLAKAAQQRPPLLGHFYQFLSRFAPKMPTHFSTKK
ncbi:MAG: oxygenase MpaB family protein [Bacteroidota bacterium]